MSSGPWTMVDVSMCGAGVAPKVGYMNGSGGATPLCHMGTFSGACSDCRRSLLISLRTQRCMPLTERLERSGGLFLDSASTLFFRVKDQVAESYQRITHRPLLRHYRLAGWAHCLYSV